MDRQYVGIDLHRRRSVIVRKDANGEVLAKTHITNEPATLAAAVADAGPGAHVVLEATYGWYWAADLLQDLGLDVHLAAPSGLNWGSRRVKTDERDAVDLADMLRLGRLPEAWIAPPATRELRELVRHRIKLVSLRTGLKAQVHAVMAKNGVLPARVEMWGPGGTAQLDSLELPDAYARRLDSLRRLIANIDDEVAQAQVEIHRRLRGDRGYEAIQHLNGVGQVLAAVFVAEIGDIHRFSSPKALCSWAGITPRHHQSDTTLHRGPVTKQGSRLVRWAAVEAVARGRGGPKLVADYQRIAANRGRFKARVAVARKLLCLVYYGMRDGEIRALREAV
ncbi:MAG: IS110 family transposase [Actinobacteria bacterium]|nr:IS110 family transposase [Actinomycetota bacterium]MBV9936763.1 IS110 family transposase [Actinomycetota bacterium]